MYLSSFMKRIICLGTVLAVGAAAAAGYGIYLENEDSLEVLSPIKPPVSSNETPVIDAPPVSFSENGTFYSENIAVELTAADENADIYYTLDGSVPTKESDKYTEAIVVKSRSRVNATTIKAIAVTDDKTSEVVTKSYVTGEDVFERFDKDTYVFVLSADPYDLYDYEHGIAIEGKIRDEWLQTEYDGSYEVNPTHPANWNQEGMAGERPMYMEVFDSDGNTLLIQQAGARVAGAYSRMVDQKSWKLIARTMYTPESGMFKYSFFDDAYDADGVLLTKYDRIVLRNGANDREFAGVRDELSMALAKQSGFLDTQATTPAAVFLNGKYYGFSWLHQNYCKGYLESRYGGSKDNFQIVGKAEGEIDEENSAGAAESYNKMLELAESGLTDDAKFEELCSMLDIDNYMHYLAMQLFIDNRDWPGNNYKAWRYVPSEGEEISGKYLDGKWRYLFYDAEFAWGLYSDGYRNATLSKILKGTHPAGGSVLISALMERADMREKLANNICDLIGGAFSTENVLAVLEEKLAESDKEQMYALNNKITSSWANKDTFENSRNEIREFAKKRPAVILKDLRKVFELEEDMFTIEADGAAGLKVKLNMQTSSNGERLTGEYFSAYGVPLSAESYSGYELDYWEINGEKVSDNEITLTADMAKDGKITVKAHAKKTVSDVPLYINEIYTGSDADWLELYNPNDTVVSTKDMYLTDDETILKKWKIPAVNVQPDSVLTIVCKNNKDSSTLLKLQTNFSLKAGETLILSDSVGNILGKAVIEDCKENESQLRQPDGTYKKAFPTMNEN